MQYPIHPPHTVLALAIAIRAHGTGLNDALGEERDGWGGLCLMKLLSGNPQPGVGDVKRVLTPTNNPNTPRPRILIQRKKESIDQPNYRHCLENCFVCFHSRAFGTTMDV